MGAAARLKGDASVPLLDGSVGDRLRDAATRFADRPAVLWAESGRIGRLTYAQMLRRSERIAAFIRQRAGDGDRIAIWSRNSLEWILLEYGIALAGAVVAAWNTAWTDGECGQALMLTKPALIFAGQDVRGVDLLERARRLGPPGSVCALGAVGDLAASAPCCALPSVGAGWPFLLQFTSGTTGRPKAAALTHHAALNAAWLRARLYDADERDVWFNPVPMTHVGGAITMLLGAMVTGSAYVLASRFEAGEFVRLMHACGATRLGGVPTMLLAALDHPGWRPNATVRSLGLGGSQVPLALVRRLRAEFGAPVLVTYGQSECPLISSSLPGDAAEAVVETVGRIVPHMELKICAPEDGRQLEVGEVGEIRVRGPVMMQGYFGAPDSGIGADGFLGTGDLGSVDAQGYLRIHGRTRDVIIRGGENIYPAEIEDVLLQHGDVANAAVVGIADERWGQQVGAVIVLRDGASATADALEGFARERLSHFKVPRVWRFVPALPMTASGKVRKVELEASFAPQGT